MHPNQNAVQPEKEKSIADSAASRHGRSRRPSLPKFKQGIATIALVTTLGLIVPGSFGGSVFADRSHNPNLDRNDPRTFYCDLDGDSKADTEYVESHYEKTYNFINTDNSSTGDSLVMFDPTNKVSMTWRTRIDVLQAEYVPQPPEEEGGPEGTYLLDTDVEWFYEWFDVYPHGKPKGLKTVRCVNIAPYDWTITPEEADMEPRLVEGATYRETDWQLFDVMLTASGKVKAQADNAQKAKKSGKHGKHHGKGNHGKHHGKGKRGH